MPFTCIAIDDEPLALKLIEGYIRRMPQLKLIQTFEDAIAGSEFIRHHAVDILFIDIEMPDISGLALVSALSEKPQVIFTTAYKNFAYEGFELDAVDFLLKPISFERFKKAVNKAVDAIEKKTIRNNEAEHFFIWSEYKQVKIITSHILYIEAKDDYVCVYLKNARPVLTLITLKEMLTKLPADKFLRIHRSYIIPLYEIQEVSGRKVRLHSGKEFPVSNSYYNEFKNTLNPKNT
ncbi:DNA-binding response regulator [Arachidicoccus ginsenosidimutans]|uniref:LytR/AlgR family response regulator transcription factor n=1 Tax=Arachidicoccus sp. BS20 TaxID=1850526 RepID=UPI0007F0AFCB|nr:LytTR family DNA-binding domain-containing protein [Arachidicoccus sp. BS20]ANI87874.1 DNA-binding response regulator [Arachidicoccus sp. BS20]